jgi:hypothetical protein
LGYWKKHIKKDLELVLALLDRHGYKILNPPKYYTVRCPCGQHQRQVHLTPSNPNYGKEVIKWARKLNCWRDDEGSRR